MFVDRKTELAVFDKFYQTGNAEFVVAYGRRRVGKSALLREFCRNKPHTNYVATQIKQPDQLEALTRVLRSNLIGGQFVGTFTNWDEVLTIVTGIAMQKRFIFVLDEFPYLCEETPALPSIIQKWWDLTGKTTKIMLVLCGSQIVMEQKVMGGRSPLFGRRTGQWKLSPLPAWSVASFFPNWSIADRLSAYAILGGVPAYLERFNPNLSLRENVISQALSPEGFLYDEVNFLLRSELTSISTYLSILKAIAGGASRISEIANQTYLTASTVAVYIQTLRDLQMVRREVPFTESNPERSKKGLYRINDPFIAFWCRFVLPNQSTILSGNGEQVWNEWIQPGWEQYRSLLFEDACHDYVRNRWFQTHGEIPIRTGRLWSGETDIDVLAELSDKQSKQILVGECKAWKSKVGLNVFHDLQTGIDQFPKLSKRKYRFALFGLNGFTPQLIQQADKLGVELITGEEVFQADE